MLDDSNSLYALNTTNDNKSSMVQRIKDLGTNFNQISPFSLYEMAAKSIPNSYEKQRLLKIIKSNATSLAKISDVNLLYPLISLAISFSFIRRALTKSQFITNAISTISALRKVHFIPQIGKFFTRGKVAYKFVTNILNGMGPYQACEMALANLDMNNLFYFSHNSKKTTKLIPKYDSNNRNNSSNSNNQRNNRNSNFQRRAIGKCGTCHATVFTSWAEHNLNCRRR